MKGRTGVVDRLLGIVAGSLGLLSVFLPWLAIGGSGVPLITLHSTDLTRWYLVPGMTPADSPVFSIAFYVVLSAILILLVGGSVLLIVESTPVAGGISRFFRHAGAVMILVAWPGFIVWFDTLLPTSRAISFGYGAGFFLAVVASFVSLFRYAMKPFFRPSVPPT